MNENDQHPNPLAGMSPGDAFAHCLTDEGLAWLRSLLDSGRYALHAPEEAALLAVAWLQRAGDTGAAAELVEELRPFAREVRFAPHPASLPVPEADAVHRRTVGEAAALLSLREPDPAVEAQREALTVWRPFEDELLSHWLRADAHGAAWRADGAALLTRYRSLAALHTRCTKHLDPKSNASILRRALEEAVAGRAPAPRPAGLLRHAVTSAGAKRDRVRQADRPTHHELTALVLRRLSAYPVDRGLPEVGPATGPVTAQEALESGLPVGTAVPPSVRAVVAGTLDAPLDVLLERGTIPSATVLAELSPQLLVTYAVQGYADASLRTLMAAMYRARRGYRHWWDPEHRARLAASPWVRALGDRNPDPAATARATLRSLAELTLRAFPGAGLPNALVLTLSGLARQADLPVPFLTEPFADSSSGTACADLLAAARTAAELLHGTVYERYYGIDYAAVRDLADTQNLADFAELCAGHAGHAGHAGRALATDPTVIEQARILTTSHLATLVRHVGIAPRSGWDGLARGAFTAATRPGATAKSTACAWRQLLFHLSLCTADEQASVLAWIDARAARHPVRTAVRIALPLAGLRLAAA
ncbi:hypothetical protein ACFWBN_11560 [Streptomyces sp. NPDC059989]|uniref:hypothetical protein n=1 Tax=Streptomyces sp. NPDC059989 TaxID=3347026 RepID=UPI0036A90DBD